MVQDFHRQLRRQAQRANEAEGLVAALSDAGDVAGALAASLLSTAAAPQRGLYLAALGYAVVYGVSLAVYRRVLGDVSDDSGSAPCSIFLELPARDVQRIVDDMTEGDEV